MIFPPPTPPPALAPGRNLAACLGLAIVQGCLVGNEPLPPSVRDAGGPYDAWQGDTRNAEPAYDRVVDMATDITDGGPYSSTSCVDLRTKWAAALATVSAGCTMDSDCVEVGTHARCDCGPTLSCDGAYVNWSSYSGSAAEAIAREFFGRPCKEPSICDCAPRGYSVCNAGRCSDPRPGGSCFGPLPDPPLDPPPAVEAYDAGWG